MSLSNWMLCSIDAGGNEFVWGSSVKGASVVSGDYPKQRPSPPKVLPVPAPAGCT